MTRTTAPSPPHRERQWLFVSVLSASRLPLAAIFLFMITDPSGLLRRISLIPLLLLLVTDTLDGALARRWRVDSTIGYVLDGVADRAAYLASLLALGAALHLSAVVVYGIVLRDIMLYALRALMPQWSRRLGDYRLAAKANALVLRIFLAQGFALVYAREFNLGGLTGAFPTWYLASWYTLGMLYMTVAYWLLWRAYLVYRGA